MGSGRFRISFIAAAAMAVTLCACEEKDITEFHAKISCKEGDK